MKQAHPELEVAAATSADAGSLVELKTTDGPARERHTVDPRLVRKLAPPRVPPSVVPRARLLDRLEEAVRSASATLVSAPPGFGKTVLLSMWAAETDVAVAWVNLDEDDDESGRFLDAVNAALATVAAGSSPQVAGGSLEIALASAVAAKERVALVLDDLHELAGWETLAALERLCRYAPPQLHIVFVTRTDPPLPLHRMRVAGELAEIRAADLAFTPDETAALVAELAPQLDEGTVELLHGRTAGWAAAVRFAALSLAAAPDPHAALAEALAEERAVADYLLVEVLGAQPPEVRDFLLRTSLADALTPELAEAVTGDVRADGVLTELERQGLLVSSLAGDDRWFRYHHLFRDFLRFEAKRQLRAELPEVHRRIAGWLAVHGLERTAIRHAALGQDWDLEAALVLEHWRTFLLFDSAAEIEQLMQRIDAKALPERPALALLKAVALARSGEPAEASRCLAAAEAAPEPSDDLDAFALMCRATIDRLTGETGASAAAARRLLDVVPIASVGRHELRTQQRALALASLGMAECWENELDAASEHLEQALELAERQGASSAKLRTLGYLALTDAAAGRLRRAAERAGDALRLADARGSANAAETLGARLALAWTSYHWDDLEAAALHVDTARTLAAAAGDRPAVAAATFLAALADPSAERGLRRLRGALGDGWPAPPLIAGVMWSTEARLRMSIGDRDAALAALDGHDDLEAASIRARLHLLDGQPWEAIELFEQHGDVEQHGEDDESPLPVRIDAALLEGVARSEVRDADGARRAVERALALGAPDAHRHVFVAGGPAVRSVLVEHVRRGTAHRSFVADVLACFDRRAPKIDLTPPQLLEPLSARERAVLAYLPTMMSNGEIANELFLSVNTVKTHLRSIYRKLGTSRRREAVELARKLQLV